MRRCGRRDTRHSGQLLKHFGISKPLLNYFQFNEARRCEEIIGRLQRGEVMEILVTATNLPFAPYLPNQPHRFGPQMIEEQWGNLLMAKKLFPLLAVLRYEQRADGSATSSKPSAAKSEGGSRRPFPAARRLPAD